MSTNNLNFKFGQWANLPDMSPQTAGTVYITTDEEAMYVDLPVPSLITEGETELKRVRIGDIIVKNGMRDAEPPFSKGAFYYFVEENALLRWNGTTWTQINSTETVMDEIKAVKAIVNENKGAIQDLQGSLKDTADSLTELINARVKTTDFETYQKEIDDLITAAQKAADDAQDDADQALSDAARALEAGNKGIADAAAAKVIAEGKASIEDVESLGYATKTYVDEQDKVLLGTENDTATAVTIYGAKSAAAEAKASADQAMAVASSKLTLEDVESLGYATKSYVDGQDQALLGTEADDASANTIYGLRKSVDNATALGQQGIDDATQAKTDAGKALEAGNKGIADAAAAATLAQQGVDNAAEALAKANEMLPKVGGTMSGNIAMSDNKITGLATPTENSDAVNKQYVDGINSSLTQAISGNTQLANSAMGIAQAALPKAGGTMSGDIAMGENKITGLATPTENSDAATKAYVDSTIASGLRANDAMSFKGVLSSTKSLPDTAEVGDTYKVGEAGVYAGISAKVGDLFINAAETDTDEPTWTHISSGYEDDYLQKFSAEESSSTIYLTDGVNNAAMSNNPSGIKFMGDPYSNIKLTVVADEMGPGKNPIHTVTATMLWGTF